MKKPAKHILLLLLCVSTWVAEGADKAGNFAIWGAGARSCHQFQKTAEDELARAPFKNYLMGYLTAYNAVAEDTYNVLGDFNLKQAMAWLDNFCELNAIDSFDRAVGRLVVERHEHRDRGAGGQSQAWGRAVEGKGPPAPR